MTIYIVWNEARTEGYATTDAQVAYEARKGSDTNCYSAEGEQMKLAQAFCEITGEESCTIETIESPAPEDEKATDAGYVDDDIVITFR